MGRNLYILAGTLLLFALVAFALSLTNIAQQPGSPGDQSLWRTMGIAFFVVAMVIALAGNLSSLFGQAERRAEDARQARRRTRTTTAATSPAEPSPKFPSAFTLEEWSNIAKDRKDPDQP